jgi:hypothetical protein
MEDIVWEIDDDAVLANVRENDTKQSKSDQEYAQPTKARLLEAQHKTYHSSKALNSDWPTSFDSKDWGSNIAFTNNEKEYVYEKDSDVKGLSDAEKARRTDATGRVRMIEKKPRYKMEPNTADSKISWKNKINNRTESFSARKSVETMEFNPSGRRREVLPPRFIFKRRYRVHLRTISELGLTRKEKHEAANKMAELSDSEEEANVPNNEYYRRSGNENPGDIGKGPGFDDHSDMDADGDGGAGSGVGDGNTSGDVAEETDDDGDLFRQSYEEISRPTSDRLFAREQRILKDLRAENAAPKNLEAWELNYLVCQDRSYERIRNQYGRILNQN